MGGDQFSAFRQWHRWQAIVEIAIICIAERITSTGQSASFASYSGLESRFLAISMPLMPVSATLIRQLAASGASLTDKQDALLPEAVGSYIARNGLYQSS
jgi:nicotinate-nucleotide adenylyltransferase